MRKFCRSKFHKKMLINQQPLCLSQFHSSYKARPWPAVQTKATTKKCVMSTILLPILPTATGSATLTKTTTTRPAPTEDGLAVLTTTGASAVSTTTTGATQPRPAVPRPKSKKNPSRRKQLVLMLTHNTRCSKHLLWKWLVLFLLESVLCSFSGALSWPWARNNQWVRTVWVALHRWDPQYLLWKCLV